MGKRLFDVIFAAALLVVVVPVVLVFALALAFLFRAWPFFLQERIGQHGRPFKMLKLRTLPPNTPRYALKDSLDFSSVPALARWLRRSHLDELPQLFCVLTGRLSLVGPRPKMPDAHEPVDATYATVRQSVRQGCTGLWQVGRDADALPHETPEYDFFYIKHQSVLMDLWILWQTVLVVTRLSAGTSLDAVPAWALGEGSNIRALGTVARGTAAAFSTNADRRPAIRALEVGAARTMAAFSTEADLSIARAA